ncbi:MAG: hypothetical protein WCN98_08805 [Verrucomicrobiaceae bacterium]
MHLKTTQLAIFLLIAASSAIAQQQPDPAAAAMKKMRESLRNSMIQVQTLEAERATLQTEKADADEKIKTLTAQLVNEQKNSAEQKAAAEKEITTLKTQAANQATELTGLKESLEKWKKHDEQAVAALKTQASERSRLASEKIMLERKVADREAKNMELYKTANEILTRYRKFGLGSALAAREPFTGISRAKLETLVQDYSDKLADQKLKSSDDKPQPTKAVSSNVTKP